jgi:septal ring factor EnvC (AmiA/AmiB activator)
MEDLQNEVNQMKAKINDKSASYKKIKQDYSKLKAKEKKDEQLMAKFFKKFENDLAFARNSILSFERDLSNFGNQEQEENGQLEECLGSAAEYLQNMKAFILQVEGSTATVKRIGEEDY